MSAEKIVKILSQVGCKIFVEDGLVCTQGGNLHNLNNDHQLWRLIIIHYPLICKHFGVPE